MNKLAIIGLILVGLGIVGFAVPAFQTRETKDVAHVGDVHLEANVNETHSIPPLAAGGVLVLGVVLLGAGMMKRA